MNVNRPNCLIPKPLTLTSHAGRFGPVYLYLSGAYRKVRHHSRTETVTRSRGCRAGRAGARKAPVPLVRAAAADVGHRLAHHEDRSTYDKALTAVRDEMKFFNADDLRWVRSGTIRTRLEVRGLTASLLIEVHRLAGRAGEPRLLLNAARNGENERRWAVFLRHGDEQIDLRDSRYVAGRRARVENPAAGRQ
jgi:hypothetical protein